MCRWIAYTGVPERLENVVTRPARSLVHQSLHAAQCKTATNGDGFGLGWYGDRETPGVYREISPAWSDENLLSLCAQLSAQTFFAHVRASTGAGTARANCHPFSVGPWLFMHNGQIGGFCTIRRRIENMIPDRLYPHRRGGTDSEAIFLIAMGAVENEGPIGAVETALSRIHHEMLQAGVPEPFRFAAAMTDGRDLTVFRWSSDDLAPSVYFRRSAGSLVVVSEPIDDHADGWQTLAANHVLSVRCGPSAAAPVISPFDAGSEPRFSRTTGSVHGRVPAAA
ncbi:MAG: class II glutamine amidotransferase [Lautropia sp.]|nr:class II glutamine amidotransferase [Lautropia sp.]